jgi:hypothetical protein
MSISSQIKGQKFNILLARFTIKYISLLMVSLIAILVFLLMYFILLPAYKQYNFFVAEELPLLNQSIMVDAANLEKLKIAYQEKQEELLQVKLDKVEQLIAKDNDKTNLYLPFGQIMKENNFILSNIVISDNGLSQFGEEQIGGSIDDYAGFELGEMTIQLSITGGGYDEIKKLLNVFRKSLRLYDVISLTFSPQSFSAEENEVRGAATTSYDLVLKTYYIMPLSNNEGEVIVE